MQLICNGVSLDLYDDAGFQFTRTNPLYSFDDLKCERTTEFKLPATKTNDRVFGIARRPELRGVAMRRRYGAQLQMGAVVKNGYLYVSEWTGKEYAAILVIGELVDVQKFGNYEWGSLPLNYLINRTPYAANASDVPMIARMQYHMDEQGASIYGRYQPSIDVHELLKAINDNGLLPISGLTGQHFRIIRNAPHEIQDAQVTIGNNQAGATAANMDIFSDSPLIIADGSLIIGLPQGEPRVILSSFKAQPGTRISFPENTPANLCLCTSYSRAFGEHVYIEFFGGRGFKKTNGQIEYYGEQLAGKTFVVPDDPNNSGCFVLMTAEAAVWYSGINEPFFYFTSADPNFTGGDWSDVPDFSVTLRVNGLNANGVYYYENEMPAVAALQNLKLSDVLKIYCAVTGRLLNVTPTGIEFVERPTEDVMSLNVQSISNVSRDFGNFAQKSFVKFEDTDDVKDYEKEIITYTIDNVNLQEETTLLEMDATEGGVYTGGGTLYEDNVLLVRGCKEETDDLFEETEMLLPSNVIAQMSTGEWLERVSLSKNNFLQYLCNQSTKVKIQAFMTAYEYQQIKADTMLVIHGVRYTWTEGSWQKNVAKFTLAKA